MKNGDMPINPTEPIVEYIYPSEDNKLPEPVPIHTISNGLTKREYYAGLAMQGLLSNPAQIDTTDFKWVAEHAIGYAKALLKQLELEPTKY